MKLRYQKCALGQIDKALGYIAERSPQGAANVEARLTAILQLLQQQPQTGAKTKIPGVRRAFLIPYPYFDRLLRGRRRDHRSEVSSRCAATPRVKIPA